VLWAAARANVHTRAAAGGGARGDARCERGQRGEHGVVRVDEVVHIDEVALGGAVARAEVGASKPKSAGREFGLAAVKVTRVQHAPHAPHDDTACASGLTGGGG
jgi:hypothetical protein